MSRDEQQQMSFIHCRYQPEGVLVLCLLKKTAL